MAYQAIYRKWRPMIFEDIVGQSHITNTLKNQILNNTVGHAYLFCGTRGTGKTTAAKVFARAVNCINNTTGSPCNECQICKGLLDGSLLDVTEIDAASNNKVENIRDIIDDTKYSTTATRYRIYIVDEVHMLTTSAFNALLKTLEEPPEHVIFILATTEPHKLPQTILSRCQRYDFRRIASSDIILRLKDIAYGDGYKITDDAYKLIARLGDGSMRDAISVLERVVSSVNGEITYNDIINILGISSIEMEFSMADAILSKDTTAVFKSINNVLDEGRDLNVFMDSLIVHFRNLLVCKVTKEPEKLLDYSIEEIIKFKAQAENATYETISHIISSLYSAKASAKWVNAPRSIYEVELIKLCAPEIDNSFGAILDRISNVEEKVKNGITIKAEEKPSEVIKKPKKKKEFSKKLYNPIPKNLQTSSNPLVVAAKKWDKIANILIKSAPYLADILTNRSITIDNDGIILLFNKDTEQASKAIADNYKNIIQSGFIKACGVECLVKTAFTDELEGVALNFWDFSDSEAEDNSSNTVSNDEYESGDPLSGVIENIPDFIESVDDEEFKNYDASEDNFSQSSLDDDEREEFFDDDELENDDE